MVKKIGSRVVTRLPIQKNNDTKILPDSFTKIPDAISVFGDDNFAILDAIRKTSEIREALPPLFPV